MEERYTIKTHRYDSSKALDRDRAQARSDFAWAMSLERQLEKSKGKGKPGKGNASDHVESKPWSEMSRNERWYLQRLWDGSLRRRQICSICGAAEGLCAYVAES